MGIRDMFIGRAKTTGKATARLIFRDGLKDHEWGNQRDNPFALAANAELNVTDIKVTIDR